MKDVTMSGKEQSVERIYDVAEFDAMMKRLSCVRAGRNFTRDEMNQR
jgi:hypothetical protein